MTGLIIFAFAIWLGSQAARGTMCGTDELLTAERTREMLVTGERLVVHYNFHRSFEKPPLQYWLTSLTLPRFENHAVAVRIWPLVYGVLTAGALAWLVRLMVPDEPWLMPLTIAVLISSPLFSGECSRGLLDIGLAFFTTLVSVFAELARKYPPSRISDPSSKLAAANGQYLLITRSAYDAVGGHAAVAQSLLEDVALARAARNASFKIRFRYGGDAVRTRMYRGFRQMREGWTKNLSLLFPNAASLAFDETMPIPRLKPSSPRE